MAQQNRHRWAIASILAIAWGIVPLVLYLPSVSSTQYAVIAVCFPGWVLAYIVCGGVHSSNMVLAPAFCAVFTTAIGFALAFLLLRLLDRRAR